MIGKFLFDGENWEIITENAKNLIKNILIFEQNKRLNCE